MTNFITHSNSDGLVKLSGRIETYKCTRARASFVFTEADRTKMGAVAIAAGMAGLGGQAISVAANTAATEEEADYVEFSLNGIPVKGWVWRSPFNEGDEVEVAAELLTGHYEAYGIARIKDRTIALYPHCSRGQIRHYLHALQWWFLFSCSSVLFVWWMMGPSLEELLAEKWLALGMFAFFGAMVFSLARKWLPFVRLAEKVFRTLGWPSPGNIDLKKRTKARRTAGDPVEYGRFYFYY